MVDVGLTGGSEPRLGGGASFSIPGLKEAAKELNDLTDAVKGLQGALGNLASSKNTTVGPVTKLINAVRGNAGVADGGAGGGVSTRAVAGNTGSQSYPNAAQNANPHVNTGGMTPNSGAMGLPTLGGVMGSLNSPESLITGVLKAATYPTTYAYNRIESNRAATDYMAEMLGPVSTMGGQSIKALIKGLAKETPVFGPFREVLQSLNYGSRAGYGLGTGNEARSGAFYENIRQQQMFTPGVGAGQLAAQNISYLSDTKSQQRAVMLTGGAMGAFGPGGVPKTLTEWAESILRWFEGQRPGGDRGKAFTKQELQTQFFPGSNMNAWFTETGVPPYMQDYFWQYAIGKSQSGTSQDKVSLDQIMGKRGNDIALQNLMLNTAQSRREFSMTALPKQYERYATRASVDTGFAGTMSKIDNFLTKILGPIGSVIDNIPTPLANLGMDLYSNVLPSVAGGVLGTFINSGNADINFVGDPDTGWGSYGGTSFIGMDPSFARRLGDMMEANPNLEITSGYRDGGTQERLYNNGVGQVAPPGQSFHSKGLAADLGPSSEFGWIAANASKFGLETAGHMGEPWHVGFPGTVPMGDPGARRRGSPIGDPNPWENVKVNGNRVVAWRTYEEANPKLQAYMRTPEGKAETEKDGGLDELPSSRQAAAKGVKDGFAPVTELISAVKDLLTGNVSGAFGKDGPVRNIAKSLGSGLLSALGLPDFLSGDAESITKEFVGMFGGSDGTLGAKTSSGSTSPMGSPGGVNSSSGAGAVTIAGGLQGLFNAYGGGNRPSPYSLKKGDDQKILAALQAASAAGFSGDKLIAMTAIAGRESRWVPTAYNPDASTGDNSYGLYQINMLGNLGPSRRKQFGISRNEELLDPNVSARAAFSLSGGGKNLTPWGGYKGKPNLYNATQYIEPVYNIAKMAGYVGDPMRAGMNPSSMMSTYSPTSNVVTNSSPVVFNTSISVGGSSGSDAEARRVGYVLADTIESEMKSRLARTY